MEITAHCVVKNEDIWVWFAIQSVLPYVNKVLIYDTGSEDHTVEVIKSINSNKIIFEEKGAVDKRGLVRLRQEQLDKTKTQWFLILDGDEIWPKTQIEKLIDQADKAGKDIVAVFNHVRNSIGDVFHYLPDDSGNYQIGDIYGNLNIRLIKKTKNLTISGEYPLEVYKDAHGPIQNQKSKLIHSSAWYLHASFLRRSGSIKNKVSGSFGKSKIWQKGLKFKESELPEVFNNKRPELVPNPLIKRRLDYEIIASLLHHLIKIKRNFR